MNEITMITLASVAGAAILFSMISLLTVLGYRKQIDVHKNIIRELRNNLRTLTSGSKGVGERMVSMDRKVRRIIDRVNQLELREADKPFDHAIQLANKGDDIDQLVTKCGMSRGEAELVVHMHGIRRAS